MLGPPSVVQSCAQQPPALVAGQRPFLALCLGCPGLPQVAPKVWEHLGLSPKVPFAGVQGQGTQMSSRPILGQRPRRAWDALQGTVLKHKLQSCQSKCRRPLTDRRLPGTQAGGILKPPLRPTSRVRKPFETGQEDILENNCLSLSFAVSSECELEHFTRYSLSAKAASLQLSGEHGKDFGMGRKDDWVPRIMCAIHFSNS